MNNLIQVPFYSAALQILDRDGQPYVPMRPVVEGMGLAWQVQHRKLMAEKERWSVTIMVTETAAGLRESLCLPLRKIFAWMNSVSANKVKPELRDTILRYQRECDEVLWQHWNDVVAAERIQMENYWFGLRPHWRPIRQRVLAGMRYRVIAAGLGITVGRVARAVRSMIFRGLLSPAKVAEMQHGPARLAALRKVPGWGQPQDTQTEFAF